MENIHVIPTGKPSSLYKSKITQKIFIGDISKHGDATYNLNIYITSDEEIKKGNWFYCFENNNVLKCFREEGSILNGYHTKYKKIILTTDQDLIKDGVQEIDDEFLEWFVKNPSCEWVNVEKYFHEVGNTYDYEIIIPKEEPKLTNTINRNELGIPKGTLTELIGVPKQETLEEVAEGFLSKELLDLSDWDKRHILKAMVNMTKWQQEQNKGLYTKEDLESAFVRGALTDLFNTWGVSEKDMAKEKFAQWFEQFKKK